MTDILLKIMVETLSVLALVTKQINQGRFSRWHATKRYPPVEHGTEKFAEKLLGESGVIAALQRLDRLTQEEARLTSGHSLGVVHELFVNLGVVIDGA